MGKRPNAAIIDLDGTLVDSNYQHVIAWQRAFAAQQYRVAAWRIHRCIGMGADQIVRTLAGDDAEERDGDDLRAREADAYAELLPEVQPFEGATGLIERLKDAGLKVVLASSAGKDDVEHFLDLLDPEGLSDGHTSADDVDATKPEPDLIEVAIEKAGSDVAVMVGDSVWDIEAAGRAGLETVAVLCGGFGESELIGAGARIVVETIEEVAREIL